MGEQRKRAGRPRSPRADGWSREAVLNDLAADESLGIKALCKRYLVLDGQTIRGLTRDIDTWKRADPDFAAKLGQLLSQPGRPSPVHLGGEWWKKRREQIAMSNPGWKLEYVKDIFETGSRLQAAAKSPYSYEHIYKMLNENYPEYDKDFAELVHQTEMKMCAELEGGIVQAFRDASSPKDKAWIATKFLERRDPTRWGRQVEMIHSGKIEHDHKHQHELKPREERLKELSLDQRAFFEREQAALPAAGETGAIELSADVIDAEFVPVEARSSAPHPEGEAEEEVED